MTNAALRTIIDPITAWPYEQQQAAGALSDMEDGSDADDLTISDEDAAEIERGLADKSAPTMSLEEFRAFIDDLVK